MVLVTGMALATAGCGSRAPGTSAGGAASTGSATPTVTSSASPTAAGGVTPTAAGSATPTAAGSANPTAAVTCAKPAPPGSTLTLGSRDNGSTYCLRVGQQVIVYLQGSPADMWAPIRSDSSALRPAPNGSLMLMRGVTGAAFTAVRPGIAHISSARPVCIARPVRCDALIAFHVTVVIAGHPQ
jgi:type V secretory pathway adhesin AidA